MSTVFRVRCDDHEVQGPQINRGPGGTSLLPAPGFTTYSASRAWSEFLHEHEWCALQLIHE